MLITISGLAGSGKSTIARAIADRLKCDYVSAGEIFRETAKKYNMCLEDFTKYAEDMPEIDKEIDKKIIEIAKSKDVVIEGRLVGIFAKKNNLKSLRVWLRTKDEIRVKRVAKRENAGYEETLNKIKQRENSDYHRYMKLYGIDIYDLSYYQLVIDTSYLTPMEIVDKILKDINLFNDLIKWKN